MISCVKDALQFLKRKKGDNTLNKDELQASIEYLQKQSSEDGLNEEEMNELVNFFTATKLSTPVCNDLLSCLIPKIIVPDYCLKEILLWFFDQVASEKFSIATVKKCLQWLTGATYFELVNISILEEYYYSFLFLLSKPYLEGLICQILCLISKSEDARRWIIQVILNVQRVKGPKPHTNALLSLLKSYCQNVVPENIPVVNFNHKGTPFDENFKKARDRRFENAVKIPDSPEFSSLQWNTWTFYNEKSKKLTRLIPSASCTAFNSEESSHGKKLYSLCEFKTILSLGIRPFEIECPAETLSLLQNLAGYHYLAFSEPVIKNRFFTKLYHTLCRVFLLELEPYSEREKIYFLNAIKELQEYAQQSIPVVTPFLFKYLLVWNGEEYKEQVFELLEWLEIRNENDLELYVFPCLRQIFVSSGAYCKCLIIDTLGKLMRNLLIMDKREQNCFQSEFHGCNVVRSIEAISGFVNSLIANGLIWNKEKNTRTVLMSALDFYETCQALEQAGDLPVIMIMPPALVYGCLFSGSRVTVARLSFLLLRLLLNSVERLYLLGVFQDFASEVGKLKIYILDYYRCLWSDLNFRAEEESFIFQHNIFSDKYWKLKERYGDIVDKVFTVDYNSSFWDPQTKGSRSVALGRMAKDFPDIIRLKQTIEERLSQVF